jgi:hypothetical protein
MSFVLAAFFNATSFTEALTLPHLKKFTLELVFLGGNRLAREQ